MDLDTSEFLDEFIEDMTGLLSILHTSLLSCKKNIDNVEFELINEIFRTAHSIKGMSASMEFKKMESLTHRMEDLLYEIRDNKIKLNDDIVNLFLTGYTFLNAMLESVENVGDEDDANLSDLDQLLECLDKYLGKEIKKEVLNDKIDVKVDESKVKEALIKYDKKTEEKIIKALKSKKNVFRIRALLNNDCKLKSVRTYIMINNLLKHGDILYSYPAKEDLERKEFIYEGQEIFVMLVTKKIEKDIFNEASNLSEIGDFDLRNTVDESEIYNYDFGEELVKEEKEEKEEEIKVKEECIAKVKEFLSKNRKNKLYKVKIKLEEACKLRSVRSFIILNSIFTSGKIYYSYPNIDDLKNNDYIFNQQNIYGIFELKKTMEDLEENIKKGNEIESLLYKEITNIEECDDFSFELGKEKSEINYLDEMQDEIFDEIKNKLLDIESLLLEISPEDENKGLVTEMFEHFMAISELFELIKNDSIQEIVNLNLKMLEEFKEIKVDIHSDVVDMMLNSSLLLKKVCSDYKIIENKEFLERLEEQKRELETLLKSESGNVNGGIGDFLKKSLNLKEDDVKNLLEKQKNEYPHMKLGEIAVKENKATTKDVINALRTQDGKRKVENNGSKHEQIRIPASKADQLIDLLEELIMVESEVNKEGIEFFSRKSEFSKKMNNLFRVTKDVQNLAISFRMITLRPLFQKVKITARDTMKKLNKKIEIQLLGENTEIDRVVSDKLLDPLLHMIKNSISHGIESVEKRLEKGKNADGIIKIESYSKKGYVFIEISDDGQGINRDIVYKKAKEKNIIDVNREYTEKEIEEFIMLPGFSTAEEVDKISGRGVGMDVVKTELKKIGGKIWIKNDPGNACKFILRVPKNMTALNGTVVEIYGGNYIIPTNYIKEIFKIEKENWVYMSGKKNMIKLRNDIIPVIPLAEHWNKKTSEKDEQIMVVLEVDKMIKSIPVKDILERREVVVKPLGESFQDIDYLFGATILGDGKAALILHIENLFKIDLKVKNN